MPKDPEKNSPDPDDEDEADTTNTKDVDSAESEESEAESSPDPAPRSKSARADRARHRDREDDERPRRRKGKRKRLKRPLPRTEAEINAPDLQTLWMLGSLAAMVLVMWGGARFACNAHPDETRKPREISTSEIASDPKQAAIELAHRWATRNFDGALELATGPLATEIREDKAKCEANSQCTGERQSLKDKVLTTGELLTRLPTSALVRVTSTGTADAPRTFVLDLTAEGRTWKASSRKAANAPIPAPTGPTGMAPIPVAPTAAASTAATPSPAASAPAPKKVAVKKPAPKPVAPPVESGP